MKYSLFAQFVKIKKALVKQYIENNCRAIYEEEG